MNNFKINIDRKKLDPEYIQSKQNFNEVLNQVAIANTSIFKSTWFYGTVGLATIAVIITVSLSNSQNPSNDKIITKDKISAQKPNTPLLASVTPTNKVVYDSAPVIHKKPKVQRNVKKAEVNTRQTEPLPQPVETTIVEEREPVYMVDGRQVTKEQLQELQNQKKIKPKSYMPNFSGVYNGEIAYSNMCGGELRVNDDVKISSFSIQYSSRYGDKTHHVDGNVLPESVCREIRELNIDQMIYVTNIIGRDSLGANHSFVAMNLTVVME